MQKLCTPGKSVSDLLNKDQKRLVQRLHVRELLHAEQALQDLHIEVTFADAGQ